MRLDSPEAEAYASAAMPARIEQDRKDAPAGPDIKEPLAVPASRARRLKKARRKAHPEHAGFFRRGLAFGIDVIMITLAALVLYIPYSEIRGALGGEPGFLTRLNAGRPGQILTFNVGLESQERRARKNAYLGYLKKVLTEEEFLKASEMSAEEIQGAFREELERPDAPIVITGGHDFQLLRELVTGYFYFILFFRLGGRSPGKRLLGLKVVDLSGRPRLTWYQAFERTHGYAASLLVGGIGFFQVLWDKGGLTMHDKLAGTTVVRLPKRPSPTKRPASPPPTSKAPASAAEGEPKKPAGTGGSATDLPTH